MWFLVKRDLKSIAATQTAGGAPAGVEPVLSRGGTTGGRQPPVGQHLGEEAGS